LRLAAHLGMTRDELRERLTVEEFRVWFMLEQIEPFGEFGAWVRAGVIASTLANIHRGKDQSAFSPSDFMPEAFRPRKEPTPKSMKEKWMAIMAAQNAIVEKK